MDNIINRILDNGFLDGTGKTYKPDILRVGRSFGPRVACVSLEERVNSVVRITESQHRERKRGLLSKMDSLRMDVSRYMTTLQLMLHADRATGPLPRDDWEIRVDLSYNRPYFVNHKMKTTQFDPPELAEDCEVVETKGGAGKEPNVWSVFDMPEYIVAADGLINALEEYHCLEYEKKTIDFALQHGNTKNVNDHIFRDCLEGVFLGSAHIVFSTLNSSGQECMANCTQFKVVVIDEAAQSVELSTLIPLRLGGRQCVLVGDPQQLSATVFSQNGAATQYDRSLFERLEDCGHRVRGFYLFRLLTFFLSLSYSMTYKIAFGLLACMLIPLSLPPQVHLLDTQYRMHPAISYFPRMQFYDNKLLDGPNVLQQSYSMPYHTVSSMTSSQRFPCIVFITVFTCTIRLCCYRLGERQFAIFFVLCPELLNPFPSFPRPASGLPTVCFHEFKNGCYSVCRQVFIQSCGSSIGCQCVFNPFLSYKRGHIWQCWYYNAV